jgi:hypothetical protein
VIDRDLVLAKVEIDVQDITVLNLQRAVQAMIDVAAHVVASEGLGTPDSLGASFTLPPCSKRSCASDSAICGRSQDESWSAPGWRQAIGGSGHHGSLVPRWACRYGYPYEDHHRDFRPPARRGQAPGGA